MYMHVRIDENENIYIVLKKIGFYVKYAEVFGTQWCISCLGYVYIGLITV